MYCSELPRKELPTPLSPRELFVYRSKLAPRELCIYYSTLSLESYPSSPPESSLYIAVSCPAMSCLPRSCPSKPPQELFPRSYSPGSCPPENSLYIAASYPLEKRCKREEDNVDLVRCASREYI